MRRWMWVVLTVVIVFAIGSGSLYYFIYKSVKDTVVEMYLPIQNEQPTSILQQPFVPQVKAVGNTDGEAYRPFTMLVLGIDEREYDVGRSDTMLLLAVNPNTPSTLIFNIPRDTRTEIIGHGTVDKINHAYAFGGVQMALATVEHFLDIKVDYVVKMNMQGFVQLVDLVGGVDVDNDFAFDQSGTHFKQGTLHLDGTHALMYTRMRYDDPRGDLGRNDRQKQVLENLMDKAMNWGNIDRVPSMLKALGSNIQMNITFEDMTYMYQHYLPAMKQMDTAQVQGSGTRIDNIYYYIVQERERKRLHDLVLNAIQ